MKGKRVFITGGNSGIGLVAASELAKQGAEIVLACKPSKKTDLAVASLNSVSSVPVINLEVDLASLDSVRHLATRFEEKFDSLDVLINNAGYFRQSRNLLKMVLKCSLGLITWRISC